jgi:N-acetylglucosamine-6-phosphate deacetylase
MRLAGLLTAALLGMGCANTGAERVTVIVGATLVAGSAEVPDSVVVVDGKHIRAVGPRPTTPIPQDSERIDGTGRVVKADAPVTEIAAGQAADLVLLGDGGKVERRMVDGKWVK